MSTKSANGGALLYIKDTINYKLRPDHNVEKEKELESIFIEILQKTLYYNWLHLQTSMYESKRIEGSLFKMTNKKTYQISCYSKSLLLIQLQKRNLPKEL